MCFCVLSKRPWFSLFMHMLDIIQLNYHLDDYVPAFMAAAHRAALPSAPSGGLITITPDASARGEGRDGDGDGHLEAHGAGGGYLRRVQLHAPPQGERPAGVSFEPLLRAIGVKNTLRVLAALLLEQRIIFVASRLAQVSACVHAALALLYPLQWQHICIPVLPRAMLSYACAPMPFVLGVLSRHLEALDKEPIEEVLFVHLETGKVWGDAELLEAAQLPKPLRESLERSLTRQLKAARSSRLDNHAVGDAALGMLAQLFGHYRPHVRTAQGGDASRARPRPGELHAAFDEEGFFDAAPVAYQPFLRSLRESQLFAAFVNERVEEVLSEGGEAAGGPRAPSAFERACRAARQAQPAGEQGGGGVVGGGGGAGGGVPAPHGAHPPLKPPKGATLARGASWSAMQHSFREKLSGARAKIKARGASAPGMGGGGSARVSAPERPNGRTEPPPPPPRTSQYGWVDETEHWSPSRPPAVMLGSPLEQGDSVRTEPLDESASGREGGGALDFPTQQQGGGEPPRGQLEGVEGTPAGVRTAVESDEAQRGEEAVDLLGLGDSRLNESRLDESTSPPDSAESLASLFDGLDASAGLAHAGFHAAGFDPWPVGAAAQGGGGGEAQLEAQWETMTQGQEGAGRVHQDGAPAATGNSPTLAPSSDMAAGEVLSLEQTLFGKALRGNLFDS